MTPGEQIRFQGQGGLGTADSLGLEPNSVRGCNLLIPENEESLRLEPMNVNVKDFATPTPQPVYFELKLWRISDRRKGWRALVVAG